MITDPGLDTFEARIAIERYHADIFDHVVADAKVNLEPVVVARHCLETFAEVTNYSINDIEFFVVIGSIRWEGTRA